MPLGVEEVGAPLFTSGCVELVGGALEDGTLPTIGVFYTSI
jgi:hypothetical protein